MSLLDVSLAHAREVSMHPVTEGVLVSSAVYTHFNCYPL